MKTRAAVAFAEKTPLEIVELDLEGPKEGEVLVEIMATGLCHTDAYTLDGLDSEGLFPSVLGHEGAGIVREVGPGVTSVAPDDHVIPLYTPECRQCKTCTTGKSNLCMTERLVFLIKVRQSTIIWVARLSPTSQSYQKSQLLKFAKMPPSIQHAMLDVVSRQVLAL